MTSESISRRQFLQGCSLAAPLAAASCSRQVDEGAHKQPNIVMIMSDDMGYSDLG